LSGSHGSSARSAHGGRQRQQQQPAPIFTVNSTQATSATRRGGSNATAQHQQGAAIDPASLPVSQLASTACTWWPWTAPRRVVATSSSSSTAPSTPDRAPAPAAAMQASAAGSCCTRSCRQYSTSPAPVRQQQAQHDGRACLGSGVLADQRDHAATQQQGQPPPPDDPYPAIDAGAPVAVHRKFLDIRPSAVDSRLAACREAVSESVPCITM
jgi:hypothetical protein